MFDLLTLPFRIAFGALVAVLLLPFALLLLPFLLLGLAIKATVALLLLPFLVLAVVAGAAVALFTLSVALLLPLLPVVFLAFCVWAVIKLASRPAPAAI